MMVRSNLGSLFTLVLSLGAIGCGDSDRPAENPSTQAARQTEPSAEPTPSAEDGPPANEVGTEGRGVLWIGHSLIRFAGPNDENGHPTVIYSVPETVEALRAAAERSGHASAKPADWVRVVASNGWAAEGYWATEEASHEFRASLLRILDRPGIQHGPQIGNSFENVALLEDWRPIPGGRDARWDFIITINGASYFGPSSYERVYRGMRDLHRFVREGVDARVEGAEYRPDAEAVLVNYMGVPPHERTPREICGLTRLYHRLDAAFPNTRTAPVAVAFKLAFDRYPRAARRDPENFPRVGRMTVDRSFRLENDSVHYAPRGVLLTAYVFYRLLFGDPTGLPLPDGFEFSEAEATLLQQIALDAYPEYERYGSEPEALGCPAPEPSEDDAQGAAEANSTGESSASESGE